MPDNSVAGLGDLASLVKINKLFAGHVGKYISLPQLVLVGDQSSGKSSVFEGLTDVPFLRSSTIRTSFATQVTFHRHATRSISVSIIPGVSAEGVFADGLRQWRREGLESVTKETFTAIMNEVHQVMGLTEPTSGVAFSKDVLKLEISGPTQEHFSVINVPGTFSCTKPGGTTKEDKQLVRDMVMGFMQNPRSVILAVIPANVDIATQEILAMAEEVDPDRQRTLGIMTKPDLVDKGAEPGVVDLVEGQRKLKLGWHIVRNLGQSEMSTAGIERHELEASFFSHTSPWKELEKDKVGVPALKIRLRTILADMVRQEFPNVKNAVIMKYIATKQELEGMGLGRETREKQYNYLQKMATRFQHVSTDALQGNYDDNIFKGRPNLHLGTKLANRSSAFSDDMQKRGAVIPFANNAGNGADKASQVVDLDCPASPPTIACTTPVREAVNAANLDPRLSMKRSAVDQLENDRKKVLVVRYTEGHSDLLGILHASPKEPFPTPKEDILDWIRSEYSSLGGYDFGASGAAIITLLWKQQSAKWDDYALGYISDIISLIHDFLLHLLSTICPDNNVRDGLLSVLMKPIRAFYHKAVDQVKVFLKAERAGILHTHNPRFIESIQAHRRSSLESIGIDALGFDELGSIKNRISYTEFKVNDIHNILKSYYKIARERLVDAVIIHGAYSHLLLGPNTPLKVFSPSFVSKLTNEQLEIIAGEDGYTQCKRKMLEKQLKDLEAGREIIQGDMSSGLAA